MRTRKRDTTALAIGSATSGVLAYLFFALSTRSLGAEEAAPVSVLWTFWSFAAAALTFPLQHWITRSVAAHGGEGAVREALPRVAALVTAAAVVSGAVAWLIRDSLFHRDDLAFPLLVAWVTLGSGLVGVVRGALSARRRFLSVAWVLAADNGVRALAAVGLTIAAVTNSASYGVCLAAASLVCLLWPSALRFSRLQTRGTSESAFRFLSGAAGGQLIGQAVLTGGPVALALNGGSASDVTALFAGLALFRAPYTVALGVVTQLTGKFTNLVIMEQHASLSRVRRVTVASTLVTSVVAALIGAWAGPGLIRLIFGADVTLSSFVSTLLAVGSAVALANLAVTVMIMAQGRSGTVPRAWVIGTALGVLAFVLAGDDPLAQTGWAFLVAEAGTFVALTVEEMRGARLLRQHGHRSRALPSEEEAENPGPPPL